MQISHELRHTQSQQLTMTLKMQQALHILQLSSLELEQHVQQELDANPLLEMKQKSEEIPDKPEITVNREDDTSFDEAWDLDAFDRKWREGKDLSRNTDLFDRQQYYQDSITQEESLKAHLLNQLRIAVDDPTQYQIGERIIIGDMDDRGYFTGEIPQIALEMNLEEDVVLDVLYTIQRMEPTGVGARSVEECLLLQIDAEHPYNDLLRTLVSEHFEDLKHRQIPQIAKAMKLKPQEVEELAALLATLDPWPGRQYLSEPVQYIAAEVIVEKVNDDYIVRLATDRTPNLVVNKEYQEKLREKMQKDDKKYVKEKMESARWLIRNIEQRQQTILKVSQAIVDVQRDFIEKGVEFIKPLVLQDIATRVGVHESTVARTTRGKYIQTPQGLFELKYFFSPGLKTDSGEDQSSKSVQAAIKQIIEDEDKAKPLSDQKIADLLKVKGTTVARRTITKYREAMNIPATTMRRQYQ